MTFLLAILACQEWPVAEEEFCEPDPPLPGEIRVQSVNCNDLLPSGSSGRVGDPFLANDQLRVVFRHPVASLTLPGVGGFTIADAAPWDVSDRIHEIAPMVGGGWLVVDDWEETEDGYWVRGVIASLPGLVAEREGEVAEVTWSIAANAPELRAEGAEGFWIHLLGDSRAYPYSLQSGSTLVAPLDGELTDLGGVVLASGTDRLLIAPAATGQEHLSPTTQQITGDPGLASTLVLFEDDVAVGTVGVDGPFDLRVPEWVTHVRADRPGFQSSDRVAVGTDMILETGASGSVTLTPTNTVEPLGIRWVAGDGRGSDDVLLPPDGGRLSFGAGSHTVEIFGGPQWEPLILDLELKDDEEDELFFAMTPRFDPGSWVPVSLGEESDRSQIWRGSDPSAARIAAGRGNRFAVFSPTGSIGGVDGSAADFPIAFRNGATIRGDGWSFTAFPWIDSTKKNARGGLSWFPEDAADAAAAASSGFTRKLVVDAGWLAAVGEPFEVTPRPDFTHLSAPGDDLAGWADWIRWLDASVPLTPTGPVTWIEAIDPMFVDAVGTEQRLFEGATVASNGPLLKLTVEGLGPGEVLIPQALFDRGDKPKKPSALGPIAKPALSIRYDVTYEVLAGEALDEVFLLGSDGRRVDLDAQSGTAKVEGGIRWLALAARSADDAQWAVTGPVWLDVP